MRRLTAKHLKIVISIVALGAIVAWFVVSASSPKQGTIRNGSSNPAVQTTFADKTLDGTYMKFRYSGKYTVRSEVATNGDMERYTLSADTRYDKRILASVTELPDGQLGSNGAYIFRPKSPSLYSYRKVQVSGSQVEVWIKIDGSEQTAIMPHGNRAAVISLITANMNDDLNKEIDALLNSFEWKN